jgi:uncharacterized membrane protein (UPF0127 family)
MPRFRPLPIFLLLFFALAAPLSARCSAADPWRLPKASLVIVTAGGPHRFTVEIADTPQTRAQGLMFRKSLPADAGMLFDFERPQRVAFWMKNTLIPLDMLFVDARGRILGVHADAAPLSLASIESPAPVRAVIEIAGGTAARLGIKPGARVLYPIFGNARRSKPADAPLRRNP